MCLCFCAEIDKIWIEKTLLEEKNVKSPKHDFYHFLVQPLALIRYPNMASL